MTASPAEPRNDTAPASITSTTTGLLPCRPRNSATAAESTSPERHSTRRPPASRSIVIDPAQGRRRPGCGCGSMSASTPAGYRRRNQPQGPSTQAPDPVPVTLRGATLISAFSTLGDLGPQPCRARGTSPKPGARGAPRAAVGGVEASYGCAVSLSPRPQPVESDQPAADRVGRLLSVNV